MNFFGRLMRQFGKSQGGLGGGGRLAEVSRMQDAEAGEIL